MTPSGGLVMGTRSGDLDPGVLVYLMRTLKLGAGELEELIDSRSGLAGISGIGGDLRTLHAAAGSHAGARLALQMFCSRAAKELAAMCTVLGGVDLIVFTGGIGENDAQARAEICGRLACIGVGADATADVPSHPASRCRVLVLPSREDEQIARHVRDLCRSPANP
jgi:acetate kinase